MSNGRREARCVVAHRTLEELDPEARAGLWLYIGEEESAEEVAACLGIPVCKARRLLARAVRKLREVIGHGGARIGHRSSLRTLLHELPEEDPPPELGERTRRAAASLLRERGFAE